MTILIVDLSAIFWRQYYVSGTGEQTYEDVLHALAGAVLAYPRMIICCEGRSPVRHQWSPIYKATRPPKPEDAVVALRAIIKDLKTCVAPVVSVPHLEADDLIAGFATQASEPVVIWSSDKDLAQLISPTVKMLIDGKLFGEEECFAKFGAWPNQIRDYLAITGDSADNIKGCPGIGAKGAAALLQRFGTLDGIRSAPDELLDLGPKTLLKFRQWEASEDAALAVKLVTLIYEIPIHLNQLFQPTSIEQDSKMADMTLGAVVTGKQNKPLKIVAFGVEGIGKTRFGAFAPKPIFICSEDGTASLDVPRFPAPETWSDVMSAIKTLTTSDHEYKTLVIDSLDWLHPLVKAQVLADEKLTAAKYESFASGEKFAIKHFQDLITTLDALQAAKGMHVICLAHSQVKPFNNPEGENFDRYQLSLPDKTSEKFKQWAYCLLFMNWESFAQAKDSGRARGVLGNRIMCTERDAAFDAKNRYGLPSRITFEVENPWKAFAAAMREANKPATESKPNDNSTKTEAA